MPTGNMATTGSTWPTITAAAVFVLALIAHGQPLALAAAAAVSLQDAPVVGGGTLLLDGAGWVARTVDGGGGGGGVGGGGITIPATVPGDIVSDLHRAGLIGNPYYEMNWLNSSMWANNTWRCVVTLSPLGRPWRWCWQGVHTSAPLTVVTRNPLTAAPCHLC